MPSTAQLRSSAALLYGAPLSTCIVSRECPPPGELLARSANATDWTRGTQFSTYVMIGCGPEGAPHGPESASGSPRRRHLPPTVRTLRQTKLQEVRATRTRPRAVLVRLLLGLPTTHQELLCWQAAAGWRRGDRRRIRRRWAGVAQI